MTSSILISKMKQHAFVVILALVCGRAAAQPRPPNAIDRPIMAAGAGHALVIKSDGTVWSWGVNDQGQLGRSPASTTVDFNVIRVPNVLGAISVAAGSYHSLVLQYDGTVLAFGDNAKGQLGLGLGDKIDRFGAAVIPNLVSVTAIDASMAYSAAVSGGMVKTWGENAYGQLGTGNKVDQTIPTNILNLSNIVSVACGYRHVLALTSDGKVWSWGPNASGQLGFATPSEQLIPA